VSLIQQALTCQPAFRCALLQAWQSAAHPFAFCPPPSASVFTFGVTASFRLGPAPIIAPCDALRGQGQRCVRPTHATQHFPSYEYPHFVGSRFLMDAAFATLPVDDPRALVAHPASTQRARGNGRFHDAHIASAENLVFLAACWLRGNLSLASTTLSSL